MGEGEEEHFNMEKFDLAFLNDIVKVYRLHDQPGPVSLKGVIDGLQIDFRYSTLTPNLNGLALVVPRTGERKIRVKRTLEPCWRRFIIGHEVGHILQYVQGKLL